ncbi:TraR/DksA C4-type zinc finger protein [Helicobacter sp. MIT 14-3879]|uniref:TraR/DksA C4-type zinc finger protein n=1 Tax=Helicobacter sp. MIT 14-3879 TaxID=2040649 RepID=UPI000E1F2F08|nr:TraR/DksA C4-type zinc finger protein [Helicobacter sp. MIT 14-3879]RDU64089.1 molecular chaperone DnaK suppressor DksA [Helicobacter sp. MIT 14-3879]
MRKREINELEKKLNLLKYEIIKSIRITSDNIDILNTLSSSEEAELGSVMSIAMIDENALVKGNKELLEINKALEKIKLNKYGKCEMCNKQIDIKRLRVKPYARYCIFCREVYEAQNKGFSNGF